jgi:peroxiredoxin
VTTRAQWTLVAAIVLVLGAGLFAATRFSGSELRQVTVGATAPDFAAATLDRPPARRTLASYRGDVVLLNIWATWCGPCRIEMPSIQRLYADLAPRGLKVVAVSVDQPGAEALIKGFVREYGLTFDVLHDPSEEIGKRYQVNGYPQTYVIGKDGVIRKKELGARQWDTAPVRALLTQLLAERER